MQGRKEYQEYLYIFIEQLSTTQGAHHVKHGDKLDKVARAMRNIKIEIQ